MWQSVYLLDKSRSPSVSPYPTNHQLSHEMLSPLRLIVPKSRRTPLWPLPFKNLTCTIAHWFRYFVKQVTKFQRGLKLPISGQWHLDETFVKLRGRWHYVFAILSDWRRTLLILRIMPRRTRKAVMEVLKELKTHIKMEPHTIVTDGLASYVKAIIRRFPRTHHQRDVKFRDHPSNNVIERFFSTFKPRYHGLRGFKTLPRAQEFLDAWGFYYNFLRPHQNSRGDPPAGGQWSNQLIDWAHILKYQP